MFIIVEFHRFYFRFSSSSPIVEQHLVDDHHPPSMFNFSFLSFFIKYLFVKIKCEIWRKLICFNSINKLINVSKKNTFLVAYFNREFAWKYLSKKEIVFNIDIENKISLDRQENDSESFFVYDHCSCLLSNYFNRRYINSRYQSYSFHCVTEINPSQEVI